MKTWLRRVLLTVCNCPDGEEGLFGKQKCQSRHGVSVEQERLRRPSISQQERATAIRPTNALLLSVCPPSCSAYSSYPSYLSYSSLRSPFSSYHYFSLPSMGLSRSENFRKCAATALCQIFVAIIVAQLVHFVTAAPTALSVSDLVSFEPCQQIHCPTGHAILDPETGECICPGSDTFRASHHDHF